MKFKALFLLSAIAFGLFACNNANQSTTESVKNKDVNSVTYSIDTLHSVVEWKGSMLGVYSHQGTVKLAEGSLTLKNGVITEGNFTVDMNSMLTTDADELYKMAPREKLIGHLKSDDFFATDKYPTASFKIKNQTKDIILGSLTIKGITHEETINNVQLTETDSTVTASGDLVFDRQKYSITYKNTMNDMVLSNDIELSISIFGKKN